MNHRKTSFFHSLVMASALAAAVSPALAQNPVITSFSQNGSLTCSNLSPGTTATVQWAPSLGGPWNSDWLSLASVTTAPNGTIHASVPMFYRVLGLGGTNTAPPGMAYIPAGSFLIGDTLADGLATTIVTNVYVSAFYIDTNLVSSNQWATVAAYAVSHGYSFFYPATAKGGNYPADAMTWYDCIMWCNARSQQAGLKPVYYNDVAMTQIYTNGYSTETGFTGTLVVADWAASGYRLPTEAEWEKAARGGATGQRFPWGNSVNYTRANYASSAQVQAQARTYDLASGGNPYVTGSQPYTSPVGSFAPNAYGLCDMAGNLAEWCNDWYASPTAAGSPYLGGSDPHGAASGSEQVIRGGSWNDFPYTLPCAARNAVPPLYTSSTIGFRCVRNF